MGELVNVSFHSDVAMRWWHLAGLTSAVAAALVLSPAAGATIRSCENVKGAEVIGVERMSCASARKLARVWVANVRRDGRYDRKLFGFVCRNRPSSVEGDTVYCRKGRRSARWYPNLPAGAASARRCPSFSASGYRISGVRVFAIPCSLGRAAVRAYARKGFPEVTSVRFTSGSGRADFGCYLYPSGVGLDGKCKGGVTKRNGRVYPYGTVDWKRRS